MKNSSTDSDPIEPQLIDAEQVGRMLTMCARSVVREADRNPDFPQPVRIGQRQRSDGLRHARFTRWRKADVDDFVDRMAGGDEARSA